MATPAQLLTQFRTEVDDADTPYLWADTEFWAYLDEAQKQFCQDTYALSDASTASVVDAAITADNPWVTLSPLIVKIRRAKLASQNRSLEILTLNDVEEGVAFSDYGHLSATNWEAITGTPRYLVLDIEDDKGRLVGVPTADDTLNLMVYRMPLNDITDSTEANLEITDVRHQRVLMDYVKYRAYSKQDAETLDPNRAESFLRDYTVGAASIKEELKRKRRRAGTVRYAGL